MQRNSVRTYVSLLKGYMMIADLMRKTHFKILFLIVQGLSAGPSGPNAGHLGGRSRFAAIFYALQFMLAIPLIIFLMYPVLITLVCLWFRIIREEVTAHTPSDIVYLLLILVAADHTAFSFAAIEQTRGFFPFYDPVEFPRIVLEFIRRRLIAPMFATGRGMAHYARLAGEFV